MSGTMSGFVIRSLYTRAWKTWIDPSSDELAKSGYVGWKCTERRAREWYLVVEKNENTSQHIAHGTRHTVHVCLSWPADPNPGPTAPGGLYAWRRRREKSAK